MKISVNNPETYFRAYSTRPIKRIPPLGSYPITVWNKLSTGLQGSVATREKLTPCGSRRPMFVTRPLKVNIDAR